MARYELVGLFDCTGYAKADKIVDEIVAQNPCIEFNKEMMDHMHWKEFVAKMNIRQGWNIQNSPCIYEVLVDREGKAHLIGGLNDFCEFALVYFDIIVDFTASAIKNMVVANRAIFGRQHHRHHHGDNDNEIFNIAVVNAPLKTLELILGQLLSPTSIIPYGLQLSISIFDEYTPKRVLDGLIMEITDMASPLLFKAKCVTTLAMAFYRCHLFLLMEDFTRTLMEDHKDWLDRIEFKTARIMNSFNCKAANITDCRILVGGEGPSCYIAEICRKMAPYSSSGPGRVIASGQHVVQCAKAEIGKMADIPSGTITRLHAYGWPGMTGCYVEVGDAMVRVENYAIGDPGSEQVPLADVASESNYILHQFSKDFLDSQQQLLAFAEERRNRSMCMAESVITTLHTWLICDPLVRLMGEAGKSATPTAAELISRRFHEGNSCYPVLNVGVECGAGSDFPAGTFMVQPSTCVDGRWLPLGKLSEETFETLVREVSMLWARRQKLIFRDLNITTIFSEFDLSDKGMSSSKAATNPVLVKLFGDSGGRIYTEDEGEWEGEGFKELHISAGMPQFGHFEIPPLSSRASMNPVLLEIFGDSRPPTCPEEEIELEEGLRDLDQPLLQSAAGRFGRSVGPFYAEEEGEWAGEGFRESGIPPLFHAVEQSEKRMNSPVRASKGHAENGAPYSEELGEWEGEGFGDVPPLFPEDENSVEPSESSKRSTYTEEGDKEEDGIISTDANGPGGDY